MFVLYKIHAVHFLCCPHSNSNPPFLIAKTWLLPTHPQALVPRSIHLQMSFLNPSSRLAALQMCFHNFPNFYLLVHIKGICLLYCYVYFLVVHKFCEKRKYSPLASLLNPKKSAEDLVQWLAFMRQHINVTNELSLSTHDNI